MRQFPWIQRQWPTFTVAYVIHCEEHMHVEADVTLVRRDGGGCVARQVKTTFVVSVKGFIGSESDHCRDRNFRTR